MIKKAFTNKKDIKEFKDKYSNGELDTEVISNLLQPFFEKKFPEIKDYCNFWWPEDKTNFGELGVLKFMISHYSEKALEESFGKHDFTFEGNRKYKDYILEFEGLTIVAPAKREVVVTEAKDLHEKLVKFENEFCQLVVDYMYKHYDELRDYEQKSLMDLKKIGIINEENKIDFEYATKAVKKNKPKM